MNEQIDLKTKSLVELKALAYDFGVLINDYRNMLNVVNQEIVSRLQVTAAETVEVTETSKDPNTKG